MRFFSPSARTGFGFRRGLLWLGVLTAGVRPLATRAQPARIYFDSSTATAPSFGTAPIGTPPAAPVALPAPAVGPDSSLLNQAPAFPGGEAALQAFIRDHLRYPPLAARNRLEGKVIVSFWVDERGRPYGFGVLRGVGGGLDEEALRVLREMPAWTPAILAGKPTLLQLRIPITFSLPR